MKKYVLIFSFFPIFSFAQSIAPQSLNSAGGNMSQTYGSVSFTVGELVVLSFKDADGNTLNSGFTSGSTVTTLTISDVEKSFMTVNVYPNPTTDLVNLELKDVMINHFTIQVVDNIGKVIYSENYSGVNSTIGVNFGVWESGTYLLNILSIENEVLGTYKIIKQ